MRFPESNDIRCRDDLVQFIFDLMDNNDAVPWKHDTVYSFLQAMAERLEQAEVKSATEPSWQLIADMLNAAASGDANDSMTDM